MAPKHTMIEDSCKGLLIFTTTHIIPITVPMTHSLIPYSALESLLGNLIQITINMKSYGVSILGSLL